MRRDLWDGSPRKIARRWPAGRPADLKTNLAAPQPSDSPTHSPFRQLGRGRAATRSFRPELCAAPDDAPLSDRSRRPNLAHRPPARNNADKRLAFIEDEATRPIRRSLAPRPHPAAPRRPNARPTQANNRRQPRRPRSTAGESPNACCTLRHWISRRNARASCEETGRFAQEQAIVPARTRIEPLGANAPSPLPSTATAKRRCGQSRRALPTGAADKSCAALGARWGRGEIPACNHFVTHSSGGLRFAPLSIVNRSAPVPFVKSLFSERRKFAFICDDRRAAVGLRGRRASLFFRVGGQEARLGAAF